MKAFVKSKKQKVVSRIISFVLVFAMCVGMLPAQALAMEEKQSSKKTEAMQKEAVAADWTMQKFGTDTDIEMEEGWLVPDENGKGFLADYGKIYQANGGNIVIYDKSAETYKDTSLEFDITVTGGQPGKYQVAFFPRFQSGKNCDGFAVGEASQLQHSYQVNGNEGWPGIGNNLGMSFQVDETYHIEMVTVENEMKVYVNDELLTSFETAREITEGTYGFRIWTQADVKTVHIANVARKEYVQSTLDKSEVIVKSGDWGKSDVTIPVTFGIEDKVSSVQNGEAVLEEGTDYTVDAKEIVLKKEYIAKQADSFKVDVLFEKGSKDSFKVTKLDTTREEYVWTPEQGIDAWEKIAGNGSYTLEDNGLHIKGETKLVNKEAPVVNDGEIEMTFEQLVDDTYMGFLFRENEGAWQGVMQDDDYALMRWYYHNSDGNRTGFHGDGSFLLSRDGEADTKLKLRFQGQTLSMWLDDQFMYTGHVSQVKELAGRMGLLTGSKCDILVKKVVFRNVLPFMAEADDSGEKKIQKDNLTVTLADDFPRVKKYDLNGKTLNGAEFKYNYVTINSVDYPAVAEVKEEKSDSITYMVKPEGSDVTFDVVFTVEKNNILDMHIKNIAEPKDELVYSIGLPNQPLISANSSQNDARLDASGFTEAMGAFHNSQLSDSHYKISENTISKTADGVATIPIITTDELSASMANNVLLNIQEFRFRAFDLPQGGVSAGFWNNEFMYRGLDGEKLFPIASEPEEKDLYCRVILTEDTNGDKQMDWQDGANALKDLVGDRIPGGDDAARSFFEVGYNFVSEAQQPFIKVEDNLKRMSNLIDGFDQILVLKGYASEGHDSGHADYDDISKRAGGAEDLNAMTEAIKDINSKFGIHINHTEAYPEAEMYNDHVISTHNAWKWMDQSKNIRREVDILNTAEGQRTMDERLNSMFEKAPGIDFVYVDTYTDDRWAETRLANNLISNGAMIGTENQNDFNRYNSWVHWPEINANSIHHFVYHTQKDVYGSGSSPIYWGGYARAESFMSWQHRNDINPIVKQFYTNQLPQKYLMCHELLKDDGTTGTFEDGVTSSNYQIRKDGRLLTDGQNKIFIPWFDENSETRNPDEAAKIYHWNTNGGETTWSVPETWSDLKNVYLYQTTQTGKKLIDTIEVVDGKVTIQAQASTPYVVYPGEEKEDITEWSVGSPIKDTGFNSRDFSIWKKSGKADIQFNDDGNGVSILTMEGKEEGSVSQTMTGLVPGQKYRAVVWAGSENGKTARITVETPDGKTHTNYVDQIVRANDCFDTYAKGKRVERVWVDFVQPEGETTAKIIFSGDACENANGLATFMESRIVKTKEPDLPKGYVANETFEYVEQGGTGIFTPEGGGDGGYHISHYTEYTDDAINIDGEYSLKMYGYGSANMRTYPATMRLEPNTMYKMEFDTLGDGKVYVQSESDESDKVLSESFEKGHSSFTFTTGDKKDYIVRIEGARVLDNFKVYSLEDDTAPTIPEGLEAVNENGEIHLKWNESKDEDTWVIGYNVYRDGKLLTKTADTEYVDRDINEYTTYEYQISALNVANTESEKCDAVKVQSGADLKAPEVVSAELDGTEKITVVFDEKVDKETAEDISHYAISDSGNVLTAKLMEDGKVVELAVENLSVENPFLLTIRGVQDLSAAKNACTGEKPIQLSVISRYYKFDEESTETAYDYTGQEDAKKTNVKADASGRSDKAARFNKDGMVQLSGEAMTNAPEWSFSAWINWDGTPTESETIFGNDVSGVPTAGMWFHIRPDHKLWASPYDGSRGVDLTSTETIPTGEWTHVALTFKDKEFVMYVNGKETAREKFETYPDSISNPIYIGAHCNGSGSRLHEFGGMIDEVKLYKTALNAEQIQKQADQTTFAPEIVGDSFVVNKDNLNDLKIRLALNGDGLKSIAVDGAEIPAGSFVLEENTLTIKEAYLSTLSSGTHKLTFSFENAEAIEKELLVIENAADVDKTDLTALIDYAKSQQEKEEYKYVVPIVKEKFEKALADALAVNEKTDATQEEVDTVYAELLKMVHHLDFTGNSESLKVLVDVAKGLNEKLYTEDSWNVLKDALAKAEKVLADENALQKEIDAARDALQKAMDSLVKIPVDKSKLQKLVNDSKKYEDKIDEYTPSTAKIFTGALQNARDILAKEDATQEEVNAAYGALQNAIFGLRLIPNKDKLDELIKEAEKTDFSKYTEESGDAVKNALKQAKAVFADENATEKEVEKAEKDLKAAMDGLKLVSNDGNTAGTDNKGNGTSKDTDKKAAKTGDTANVMWLFVMVVATGAVLVRRKKAK